MWVVSVEVAMELLGCRLSVISDSEGSASTAVGG
jgi:hypothetical protein